MVAHRLELLHESHLPSRANLELMERHYLVALVGPRAHSVLTDLTQRSAIALARGDLNGLRAWAIPR